MIRYIVELYYSQFCERVRACMYFKNEEFGVQYVKPLAQSFNQKVMESRLEPNIRNYQPQSTTII